MLTYNCNVELNIEHWSAESDTDVSFWNVDNSKGSYRRISYIRSHTSRSPSPAPSSFTIRRMRYTTKPGKHRNFWSKKWLNWATLLPSYHCQICHNKHVPQTIKFSCDNKSDQIWCICTWSTDGILRIWTV